MNVKYVFYMHFENDAQQLYECKNSCVVLKPCINVKNYCLDKNDDKQTIISEVSVGTFSKL